MPSPTPPGERVVSGAQGWARESCTGEVGRPRAEVVSPFGYDIPAGSGVQKGEGVICNSLAGNLLEPFGLHGFSGSRSFVRFQGVLWVDYASGFGRFSCPIMF